MRLPQVFIIYLFVEGREGDPEWCSEPQRRILTWKRMRETECRGIQVVDLQDFVDHQMSSRDLLVVSGH